MQLILFVLSTLHSYFFVIHIFQKQFLFVQFTRQQLCGSTFMVEWKLVFVISIVKMQLSVISVQAPNQNRIIALPVPLEKLISDQGESMKTLKTI